MLDYVVTFGCHVNTVIVDINGTASRMHGLLRGGWLILLLLLLVCSYFVVDCEKIRDAHIQEISLGFYPSNKLHSSPEEFSLNIGQIQVSMHK